MESIKKIAIYMDHFMANVIVYSKEAKLIKTIKSDFNQYEKQKIIQKGEIHFHNKEQDAQSKFYKEISDSIIDYSQVLLFGTTNAKTELANILSKDNRFSEVTITIKNTDKLTTNKQIAFVNNCYYIV